MARSLLGPAALVLVLLPTASRGEIRAVGVVGNSGVAGETLLRVAGFDPDRSVTGAAVDADGALWLSGGDAIQRVSLDGRLIDRHPLEPVGSRVEARTFAVLDGRLYFIGRLPEGELRLFGLLMARGEVAAPLDSPLPPRPHEHTRYCLAAEPLDGRLILAAQTTAPEPTIGVYDIDPLGQANLAFTVSGDYPHGVVVDGERHVIYLGARLGLFVGGETHGDQYSITALDPQGRPVSDVFPTACTKTPATPTQFRGVISRATGGLWDTAWYGFLARLDANGRGAPGRVVQWHHELGYPGQIAEVPGGGEAGRMPAVTTGNAEAVYLAHWDRGRESFELRRRIGCLPVISNLGLSPEGWITVGTARAQLWWRWDDPPWAAPHKAELHVGVTPVHWAGDRHFSLAAQYSLADLRQRNPVGTVFEARVGDRNEARRVTEPIPLRQPLGLSVVTTPGRDEATLYATDAETRGLYRTTFWLPELKPTGTEWSAVAMQGTTLDAPTDVRALADGRVLLADAGRVLLLEPEGEGLRVARAFDRWGEGLDERFGGRVRFAVSGPWLLAADTERHRLVWLDWTTWTVLGQFGETGTPGADARHLDTPAQVALQGARALVADTGNQRVLKLELGDTTAF